MRGRSLVGRLARFDCRHYGRLYLDCDFMVDGPRMALNERGLFHANKPMKDKRLALPRLDSMMLVLQMGWWRRAERTRGTP